jgi:hypothetical protein
MSLTLHYIFLPGGKTVIGESWKLYVFEIFL